VIVMTLIGGLFFVATGGLRLHVLHVGGVETSRRHIWRATRPALASTTALCGYHHRQTRDHAQ
jgi:hypothetical protein